jgi:hypothetical protein
MPACAAVLAAAAVLGLVLRAASDVVAVEDRNLDGRADVRRTYDSRGRLTHVAIDTNFDGRWDVEEFYEDGSLARRESDRDFNDRTDVVEEFDARTEEPIRSVVDLDSDGVADVLVLVADGRPVLATRAPDEMASRDRTRPAAHTPSGEALAPARTSGPRRLESPACRRRNLLSGVPRAPALARPPLPHLLIPIPAVVRGLRAAAEGRCLVRPL